MHKKENKFKTFLLYKFQNHVLKTDAHHAEFLKFKEHNYILTIAILNVYITK